MSVNKDPSKNGQWLVSVRYQDYTGQTKQKCKRGFKTKREGLEWEREFIKKSQTNLDMTFKSFVEIYAEDTKHRVKQNTWRTKESIIENKLLPYFKDKKMDEIKPADIIKWQNQMMKRKGNNGKPMSPVYLKTIHNQLSAIFNHAIRYYELPSNPAQKAGNMGKEKTKEMLFWTKEEYLQFSEAMMDKPMSYYIYEVLYWTGIRSGELLALTKGDFNFEKSTLRINKSYQRIGGEDIITDPKTPKSNRIISMPDFLSEELQEYINSLYKVENEDRIFPVTKSYLQNEMARGCKETGVKKIRNHDLRHSHCSLLINMGFSAVAIADRLGHESIDITYRYAHLFPTKQGEIADKLSIERGF
ncbi:site-specific integrase [Chakrabartyella piscis]|uniref:site-specific integrase n=1 Tax=Chakrabartyella piscis TaxID=2918914 RepID=UPI0029586491|nr:site-specific integrase [Chakrabartyella piscis]